MTPEGRLVAHIKSVVASAGGQVRKVAWEGRIGAPDLLIMIGGRHFWVECKAPGKIPRMSQLREFDALARAGGVFVRVFDDPADFDFWWAQVLMLQPLEATE